MAGDKVSASLEIEAVLRKLTGQTGWLTPAAKPPAVSSDNHPNVMA